MCHVFLLIEGILQLCLVLPFLVLESVCPETTEEKVGIEVTRGLTTQSESESIHIVAGDNGVDGHEVHLVGRLGQLQGVLKEQLEGCHENLVVKIW